MGLPRKGIPKKNLSPRLNTTVNDRQERFALEYCKDFDRLRAYRAAGYKAKSDEAGHVEACRLLKNPKVWAIVLEQKAKIAESMGMTAQKNLLHFQVVYYEAMKAGDYSAAVAALDKIAKHYGLYEKHQKQKNYSREDVEKMKAELEAVGFDFRRLALLEPGSN